MTSRDQAAVQLARIHGLTRVIVGSVKVAGVVWCAYYARDAVIALAGHQTTADILLRFLGKLNVSSGAAWLFGAGGISYGVLQRRLSDREKKRLGPRVRDLEARVDPGRTSSDLDSRGRTPEHL